jgi:hypothetical protein
MVGVRKFKSNRKCIRTHGVYHDSTKDWKSGDPNPAYVIDSEKKNRDHLISGEINEKGKSDEEK